MHRYVRIIIVVTCLVGVLSNMSGAWSQPSMAGAKAPLPIPEGTPTIQFDSAGLTFSWDFPAIHYDRKPDGSLSVAMDGLSQLNEPGKPMVPVGYLPVAIPPGATPRVVLQGIEETEITGKGMVELAPEPAGATLSQDGAVIPEYVPADPAQPFNPNPVEFQILGVVRGVTLGRLVFYPVRVNGTALRVAAHLAGRLEYNAPAVSTDVPAEAPDPVLATLASQVVNSHQVAAFQQDRINETAGVEVPAVTSARVIVEITQPGITQITYNHLQSAGFPVGSVNPQNLHLMHDGTEVAIEWDGDTDVNFESNERILFFADPTPSRWQTSDTYLLQETALPGNRMGTRSANPSGVGSGAALLDLLVEQNTRYTPDCLCGSIPAGRDGDHWVWDVLKQPDITSKTYSFSLPLVDSSKTGKLKLWLIGYTNTSAPIDHRVSLTLNGKSVTPSQVEWNGKVAFSGDFDIAASTLTSNNNLTIMLPGIPGVAVEGMWLDAFLVRYPLGTGSVGSSVNFRGQPNRSAYSITMSSVSGLRVYDVTDSNNPQILTGASTTGNIVKIADPAGLGDRRYTAAANTGITSPVSVRLKTAPVSALPGFNGVDYVIITHSTFTSALLPFINYRQSQGLTVLMEDVQAIYDHYSSGRMNPDAIRAFIDNAYHTWPTPPDYILLVGDGTADPRMYYTNHPATYIPPYLVDVDPWMGETAADNRYVAVDGADILPDLLIGRWVVDTLAEAQAVVQKTINYEQSPVQGSWVNRYTYVTDDADQAGDFPSEANGLIGQFSPQGVTVEKFYYPQGLPTTDPLAAIFRSNVLTSWNNGQSLFVYIGHSSAHQWAAERLIHYNDVPTILNGGKLPVLLELTCFTTAFHLPSVQTLDEALFRQSGSAAIAVWGPSGLGISNGHVELAKGFLGELQNSNPARIGEAALAGKLNLATNISAYTDMLDTYHLLGDPYTKFSKTASVTSHAIYLPLVRK